MRKMRHITLLVVLFCTMLPLAVSAGFAADAVTISARNFGAKGDGVTDDTAAIQAAIDAAAKSTGVAHLPAGKYLITNSLVIPANVTLLGEGRHWENRATQIHIKKDGFPGIRLTGFWASVKGLHILYPDNTNMKEPTRHPPAIQIEAGHAAVEDIDLSLAWDGISTPPGGANAGQSVFKNITGFAHNVGLRLAGPVDVVRIEDVHWFIPHGVDAFGNSPYYYDNRVGFEIQNVDGLVMTRCFMIFGKTFFHQTGKGSSLGHHISQCWVEHVQNGFVIEGICGLVLSDSNILIHKPDGCGIKLTMPSLYYNATISNTQVRYCGAGSGPAVLYSPTEPHFRNWLGITNCQFDTPLNGPSVVIGPKAQRATIQGTHITGKPAIKIEKGAEQTIITGNFIQGGIEDNSAKDSKKIIKDNIDVDK